MNTAAASIAIKLASTFVLGHFWQFTIGDNFKGMVNVAITAYSLGFLAFAAAVFVKAHGGNNVIVRGKPLGFSYLAFCYDPYYITSFRFRFWYGGLITLLVAQSI